jgi:hypothetical protein
MCACTEIAAQVQIGRVFLSVAPGVALRISTHPGQEGVTTALPDANIPLRRTLCAPRLTALRAWLRGFEDKMAG